MLDCRFSAPPDSEWIILSFSFRFREFFHENVEISCGSLGPKSLMRDFSKNSHPAASGWEKNTSPRRCISLFFANPLESVAAIIFWDRLCNAQFCLALHAKALHWLEGRTNSEYQGVHFIFLMILTLLRVRPRLGLCRVFRGSSQSGPICLEFLLEWIKNHPRRLKTHQKWSVEVRVCSQRDYRA